MTIPNSWIRCYPRKKEELRQPEKLLQFFEALAKRNCYVASTQEIGTTAIWKRYVAGTLAASEGDDEVPFSSAIQPGVSEYVEHETRVYTKELQNQLMVEVRLMAKSALLVGFEFTVTLALDDSSIILSVDQERFFQPGLGGSMKFRYWVKLLQETYTYWHPFLMYEFTHRGAPSLNPTWDEAAAQHLPTLYTLNLLSPELVATLGRERLMQVPVWMRETLDDQGMLLIPTDVYGFTPEQQYSLETVLQQLGLASSENSTS